MFSLKRVGRAALLLARRSVVSAKRTCTDSLVTCAPRDARVRMTLGSQGQRFFAATTVDNSSSSWDVESFNNLVAITTRKRRTNHAQNTIVDERMRLSGVAPNQKTIGLLVDGWIREGQVGKAQELVFNARRRFNVVPDVGAYNSLIRGWAQRGNMLRAEEIISVHLKRVRMKPDTATFNQLILGYARKGDLERAEQIINQEMPKASCAPNTATFTILVHGFAKAGNVQRAEEIVAVDMVNAKCQPNEVTFTSLIEAWSQAKDRGNDRMDRAIEILENDMVHAGADATKYTYNTLIFGLAELCDPPRQRDALRIWRKLRESLPDVAPLSTTYEKVIHILTKQNDRAGAVFLWTEMQKLGVNPLPRTFLDLIYLHSMRRKDPDTAMEFFQKFLAAGFTPNTKTWRKFKTKAERDEARQLWKKQKRKQSNRAKAERK